MPSTSRTINRAFLGGLTSIVLALGLTACAVSSGNDGSLAGTSGASSRCLGTYTFRSSDQHVNLPGLPNLADNSMNSTVTPTPVNATGCASTDPNVRSCIYVAADQLRVVVRNGHVTISNPTGHPLLATGRAKGDELDLIWMTYGVGSRSVVFDFRCGEVVR